MDESGDYSPMPVNVPPGFWVRDETYAPEPVMPMWRSVFLRPLSAGFKYALDEMSVLAKARDYDDIGGWVYFRASYVSPQDEGFASRVQRMSDAIRTHGELRLASLWENQWKPKQRARIVELTRTDLASLSDDGLSAHVGSVLMPFLAESLKYQAVLETIFICSLGQFATTCQALLGWGDAQIVAALSGLSKATTEQTVRLAALARLAQRNEATVSLLAHIGEGTLDELRVVDPGFSRSLDTFLRDFGCRILHHAIHYPTLREKPALILRLVADQIGQSVDPLPDGEGKRLAMVQAARAALACRPSGDRKRFERALESAEQIYPLKEGGEYDTMDAPMALMRYGLLELGRRLVRTGRLDKPDEVFFFELDDLLRAFENDADMGQIVARRKAERTWAEAHPGPQSYGQQSGPPTEGLPDECQEFVKGSAWVLGHYYGAGWRISSPSELHGLPASAGVYTGPARVVMNESELDKLRGGDVLVCRATSPSWAMLFPSLGAIVTDVGGILSHPAIIAREYGVPAVVATKTATKVLNDGQIVTVDGGAGVVRIERGTV